MLPSWKADGWVKCPACETWCDGATVFGDAEGEDIGIESGTEGECDACGVKIVVRLEVGNE